MPISPSSSSDTEMQIKLASPSDHGTYRTCVCVKSLLKTHIKSDWMSRFWYKPSFCVKAMKALARLRKCAGSPELSFDSILC